MNNEFTYYVEFDFGKENKHEVHFKKGYLPKNSKNKYPFRMETLLYEFIKDIYDNNLEDTLLYNLTIHLGGNEPKDIYHGDSSVVISEDKYDFIKTAVKSLICAGIVVIYTDIRTGYDYEVTISDKNKYDFRVTAVAYHGEKVEVETSYFPDCLVECIRKNDEKMKIKTWYNN